MVGRIAPLPVATFEVAHELDQRVDACLRERVVDRRAHPADRTVTLQAVQAGRRGLLDELLFELFAAQPDCTFRAATTESRKSFREATQTLATE